jgi:hypothetical protein
LIASDESLVRVILDVPKVNRNDKDSFKFAIDVLSQRGDGRGAQRAAAGAAPHRDGLIRGCLNRVIRSLGRRRDSFSRATVSGGESPRGARNTENLKFTELSQNLTLIHVGIFIQT